MTTAAASVSSFSLANLSAAVHELQLVAVEVLTRLLRTEQDPRELRRLLAIAMRARDPSAAPQPRSRRETHPQQPAESETPPHPYNPAAPAAKHAAAEATPPPASHQRTNNQPSAEPGHTAQAPTRTETS